MNKPDEKREREKWGRQRQIFYYLKVFVDGDAFEQDREANLKILKCFDNVPFLVVVVVVFAVVGNCCLGDIEQGDTPSTEEVGEEFC